MIQIPKSEMVKIDQLKLDEDNPNIMQPTEFNALKKNIKKFGFLIPVITNIDYKIADGEHRLKAAKELGMNKVPAIRLKIKDVDRRILRQVLNKLRGTHNPSRDKSEIGLIIGEGKREDLMQLLAWNEEDINKYIADKGSIGEIPPITPEYLEEYNFILIFSRTQLDWNVLSEKIGLPTVRTNEPEDKYKKVRKGIGRVFEAAHLLRLLK